MILFLFFKKDMRVIICASKYKTWSVGINSKPSAVGTAILLKPLLHHVFFSVTSQIVQASGKWRCSSIFLTAFINSFGSTGFNK